MSWNSRWMLSADKRQGLAGWVGSLWHCMCGGVSQHFALMSESSPLARVSVCLSGSWAHTATLLLPRVWWDWTSLVPAPCSSDVHIGAHTHVLLIAMILFLNWLFTECWAVGVKNKTAGICFTIHIYTRYLHIIKYQNVPWGKDLTKSVLLNLPLFILLSCFTWSLDYSGRTSPLFPCAGISPVPALSFARGWSGNILHRSSFDHLAGTHMVMDNSASDMDLCCPCSLGFPSVFIPLGFGLSSRDVRESAGMQRILCQTCLLWDVADADPKHCCGKTDRQEKGHQPCSLRKLAWKWKNLCWISFFQYFVWTLPQLKL